MLSFSKRVINLNNNHVPVFFFFFLTQSSVTCFGFRVQLKLRRTFEAKTGVSSFGCCNLSYKECCPLLRHFNSLLVGVFVTLLAHLHFLHRQHTLFEMRSPAAAWGRCDWCCVQAGWDGSRLCFILLLLHLCDEAFGTFCLVSRPWRSQASMPSPTRPRQERF